jgi:hypothetical protein
MKYNYLSHKNRNLLNKCCFSELLLIIFGNVKLTLKECKYK